MLNRILFLYLQIHNVSSKLWRNLLTFWKKINRKVAWFDLLEWHPALSLTKLKTQAWQGPHILTKSASFYYSLQILRPYDFILAKDNTQNRIINIYENRIMTVTTAPTGAIKWPGFWCVINLITFVRIINAANTHGWNIMSKPYPPQVKY